MRLDRRCKIYLRRTGRKNMKPIPESTHELVIELLKRSGESPEIVYAYGKTGRVIFRENRHELTQEVLEEWDAAVAEYFERERRRIN